MKTIKANEMLLEEQLGLRLYNLEQCYQKEFIVRNIMQALAGNEYKTYDDEFYLPYMELANHSLYIHSVSIVRYFGMELVARFLSFNYGKEVDKVNETMENAS